MLNGMMDQHNNTLSQRHLEYAKDVVGNFTTVLILEDGNKINLKKLEALFGKEFEKRRPQQLHIDILKHLPEYTKKQKAQFEDENKLDIELFEYVRERFSM